MISRLRLAMSAVPGPMREIARAASLLAIIFIFHRSSLGYGLFLDDHAHYRQLQECGWSIGGLVDACRLELVGGVADLWFLPECTLRFFRPVAFGLMRLTYVLTGWSPSAMHAASLGWHLAASVLLMMLLRQFGGRPGVAWAVAALFAVHPGFVATVQWIACQTELMVTTFLLAAMLCYLRSSGWSLHGELPGRPARRWPWAVGSALCFAAALGCRENAVMFPVVVLALELPGLRRRWRKMLPLYAALLAMTIGYLILRSGYLGAASLPPYPYVHTPGDPGFLRFVFDKGFYYLLGEFLLAPTVPFGGLYYLRARPLLFYGLSAAVVLPLLVSLRYVRRGPGLLALAWLLGFMAPVLPAFASPHHLYLPGAGWAIIVMFIVQAIGGANGPAVRWRRAIMWLGILLLGCCFAGLTLSFGQAIDTAQRVEDLVAAEIGGTPGLADGDTLYVANLPIIAHYARLAVERETGLRRLRVCVLTWAPRVLGLLGTDIQSELTWVNDRTVEFRLLGDRYFAGAMGHLVTMANGRPPAALTPTPDRGLGFVAEVLEYDEGGVCAFRFTFDKPLTDPRVHLFWGSRVRTACEVRPEGGE